MFFLLGGAGVKAYRSLQQWNDWLAEPIGQNLLSLENSCLQQQFRSLSGQSALLIGVPAQLSLLRTSQMQLPMFTTALRLASSSVSAFQSDFNELPIASGSIDLVILAHTLDYAVHPHKLLLEACRIVRPNGHIAIVGFNPYSLWGLRKYLFESKKVPWNAHFLAIQKIIRWLRLADFSLLQQDRLLFQLPLPEINFLAQVKFLELIGKKMYKPLGGIYFLLAQAKTIPLTPIRMTWKQGLKTFSPSVLIGSIGRVVSS